MKRPSYNDLVFINCPYDESYSPLLRAIVYTVYRCGFFPLSALNEDNGLENRIDKIFRMIEKCRYGVHDISRVELSSHQLPRFNMCFELGLFFGARRYGDDKQRKKSAIVLEGKHLQYRQCLSDISGIDIWAHNGDVNTLIRQVRNWLAVQSRRNLIPHAPAVISNYEEFQIQLPTIASRLQYKSANEIIFNDFCKVVEEVIKEKLQT